MCDNYQFGERLSRLRKQRWIEYKENYGEEIDRIKKYECCKTQDTFAAKLGLERRAISGWETGKSLPNTKNLKKLCDILDCSVDYLFGFSDYGDTQPIALASHFSGISPEIIRYGLEHPEYLNCLNFFMHPDNCKSLFNEFTINAWRKYNIDSALSTISSPLREKVITAFEEYSAVTPIQDINKKTYSSFLKTKFPKDKIKIKSIPSKDGKRRTLKKFLEPIKYQNFYPNKKYNYSSFIKHLVDYTFEPLSQNSFIEVQKAKLSKAFIDLFTRYLEMN